MTVSSAVRELFRPKPVVVQPPPKSSPPDDTWVQVILQTDKVTPDQLKAACAAVQIQVRDHLAPAWFGYYGGAVIEPIFGSSKPSPDAWWLVVLDNPDTAGALGYHDLTPQGKPMGKVFTQPTLQSGEAISGVISHETCEMIVDPLINQYAFDNSRYAWAMETSDAVQGHDYDVNGVKVADFVTSRFFDPLAPNNYRQGAYDHMGVVAHPFQTMPTGYQIRLGNNGTVEQILGHMAPPQAVGSSGHGLRGSRRERRYRGHRNWEVSNPKEA